MVPPRQLRRFEEKCLELRICLRLRGLYMRNGFADHQIHSATRSRMRRRRERSLHELYSHTDGIMLAGGLATIGLNVGLHLTISE
jgi:hypothetical protein